MKQGKKQKFSRLLALLLAFVMVFTMMPAVAWADGTHAGGTGNVIRTAAELPAVIPAGSTYELAADITLESGQQIETLAGVLDGKGHTITLSGKPLAVNVSGTIQNLGVRGSVTTPDSSSEGVLAITLDGGIIQNSYSVASITGGKFADVGGIAGTLKNNAVVRNCFFAGDGTPGQYATVGGISVYANDTNTISNCFYIEGSITAYTSNNTTKENCDIKTSDEFKSANMAILLNNNIEPTGYIWQFIEGESYPTLVEGVLTQTVDKSGLEAAINKAEALIESDYVAESWQPFKIVLESAKAVYNDEAASKSDVNTATNNLESAIKSLEKKKPTVPVEIPEDAIPISSKADLEEISSSTGKYYVLTQDIVMEDTRTYYGAFTTFDGVLDGQGYTITFKDSYYGIFYAVGKNGIIQNVHFTGNITSGVGPLGNEIKGSVINCYSEVSGNSSGFAKRLSDGVLSNCYSISSADNGVIVSTADETYKGILNNVYWMNGLNNTEILVDGTILTFTGYTGGCSMEYMQSMDLVDLLNENRDTYGSEWGQSSSGYPYFGENQEFTSGGANLPANKTTVAFKPAKGAESAVENQQLIVDKNVLNETGFAGTFSLPEYVVPEGAKVQWECTQQSIDGVAAVSLEDDEWGNKGGELAVYREGSFVITATLVKADETTELLASVRVTTFVSKIEDIELYIMHGDSNDAELIENDSVTATGSEDLQIVIRAKYTGETVYRPISGSGFNIEITAEEGAIKQMSGSSIFSFTQPGKTATVTVTNKHDSSITKTFTATSTYVPVTSITPGISGTITIHHRNSNMDESEFLHIKGSVNVSPSNASFSGGYTVTSSDETIGKYHASSGEFVPLKAGEVTYIATIDDNGSKSGESTVTFVYANPLKSVSVANDNLAVKKNASISAGLVFEGINEGYNDVSEAGMTWSFDKEGIISISRESGGWKQGEGEQNTGYFNSNEYLIYGLEEGTVKITGTPVDTTGGADPVTFTVTVTEGDPEVAADNVKIVKEGIELAQGYLQKNNASRDFEFGDEWLVFILERSGSTIDPAKLEKYVESVGTAYANPAGDTLKPTTIARTILALEAIGEDSTDVGGVNLVEKLYSSSQIINGGNEAMWALIALDAVDFELPDAAWTREKLITEVLAYQSANGGFAWASKTGEPDVDTTAMAIQALVPYNTEDYPDVQTAITEALEYLKMQMNVKCQYSTGSESSAQVLIAVSALGKDVLAEENGFVKSVARNLITGLNEYKVEGKGFKHVISATEENAYATLQALQGFEAYRRFADNEKALYDLSDVSAANALAKRIAEAEALDESNYHEGLWADLETALTEAKRVAADEDATEEQIKTADVALAAAIAALLESNPTPGVAADDINVYVTIAVKGELATGKDGSIIGDAKVTVVDRNSDGKHTVDEVLYAAHEKYYPGSAAAGYSSAYGGYGLAITKLWGDTSGAFGYWQNNVSCINLEDVVTNNSYVTAFVYKDGQNWSDAYSKFDKETYSASIKTSVELKVEKAGYDASWNTVFSTYEGAKIKVIGETSSRTSTDSSGNASLSFDKAGIYKVVAYSEDGLLVPSVATITVTDPSVPKETVYLSVVNPSGSTYLSKTAYDFELGQTALSILLNSGLDVVTQYYAVYGSHYVKSIEGLGEFDGGAQSGWMYKVNGYAPDYGASLYKLKAGDYVEWLYTKNLGADIGAGKEEEKEEVTTVGGGAGATGEPVTTTTPTEVTVVGSTATATVKKENVTETLKQATENKASEIVLQVSAGDTKGAANIKVQLDTTTVKDIAGKTEAVLTVKTENATVTLDRETLKTVAAEAAGSTVTLEVIEVAAPTAAHKEAAGENGHIIQLVIKSGTKTISLFNEGKATVTVEIPSKLYGKKVAAIHIADDGIIEHLKGEEVTVNGKKHYRFDTPHFSTFALVDADEIGLEVEDKTMSAEEVKAMLDDISLVARSAKVKKGTKVTLKLDKADKAIIEALEAEGFTVKYKFYRSTKKTSKYQVKLTSRKASYTNTGGKKGTKYYYKARVQVYDAEGKLIARTELKQCKYACRKWTK